DQADGHAGRGAAAGAAARGAHRRGARRGRLHRRRARPAARVGGGAVTLRLRRSELSTPGSSERMIEKAAASAADLVFLDLEDSVAPAAKEAARAKVVAGLRELDWGAKTRAVRVNAADTEWAHEDVIEVVRGAGDRLDLLILPKVR